ncbi:MAG: helix-turn-helix transcriptional regulator [Clostridia bacterium]|nr:helix-turn-helix transcriptional regulator [Clostridia bacterium]
MNTDDIVISKICTCGTIRQPTGITLSIENRASYAISFCIAGKITYKHKAGQYVSDKHHAIFHPKGENYTLVCNEGGDFPVINFDCVTPIADEFTQFTIAPSERFIALYKELYGHFLAQRKAKAMSVLYEILALLSPNIEQAQLPVLAPALKLLRQRYTDPDLTVALLSQTAHVSEGYFRKLFQREYGVSPKQYLCELRIDQAKRLLSEKRASITEIAEACGFSSVYYFCQAFRESVGMTASEYAKGNTVKL